MSSEHSWTHKINRSAILTATGAIFLFLLAGVGTVLIPHSVEDGWTKPSSAYQKQMYEMADGALYISNTGTADRGDLQMVRHLKEGFNLLAFQESNTVRIVAPKELETYITRYGDKTLKLTSDLLLLQEPQGEWIKVADELKAKLKKEEKDEKLNYEILQLYKPEGKEVFSLARCDGISEDWVDEHFEILDSEVRHPFHADHGVIYVNNPVEYRVSSSKLGGIQGWGYDPKGKAIADLETLKGPPYGFLSRKELIDMGEDIYRIEGCWYCHTDQTRTLIQDVILNGAAAEPAPPSTASEYVYQHVSFTGTRRIGPDLSRTGAKRPSRDWHRGHFWEPRTESPGTIMPRFQHFFDDGPCGAGPSPCGVPNYKFEAIYQYLMTKGTRITSPTEAWWLGKDPVDTKAIIDGRKPRNLRGNQDEQ